MGQNTTKEENNPPPQETGEMAAKGYTSCSFFWADPERAMEAAEWSGDKYPPTESDIPSTIKIPDGSSSLSNDELIDKIKGVIYGQAIGDAIGLATEFLPRPDALKLYPTKEFSYNMFVRDGHRSRWKEADWTDDTDQMILILDGLNKNGGVVDEMDFAQRIWFWMKHGFPPIGDLVGLGIGQTVRKVVTHPDYLKNPHGCAKFVWEHNGKNIAPNGAMMRTGILGTVDFYDIEKVIANTKKISYCTHADPRCTASCVAATSAIAYMLKNGVKDGDVSKVVKYAFDLAKKELQPEEYAEFDKHANATTLDELKLDDEKTMGYTYKCFGSAFYCFQKNEDFKSVITELILHGGDADTNAAVAGALIGCKIGYKALPQDWVNELRYKSWLDEKVDRFLRLLGLIPALTPQNLM